MLSNTRRSRHIGHRSLSISKPTALAMWSQDNELQGLDRYKACVPYLLPLLDGDEFGYYIYSRFPPLAMLDDLLLGPATFLLHKFPFLSVIFFLLLTLGTRFQSETMSRNVRFNAQQAALIDVALILPQLVASSFQDDVNSLPRGLVEPCTNFVYYCYMTAILYSIYSNLNGKKPDQIPIISESAELMVGPF
jgi:Chloroplast import apparatus Tic20-like